MKAGYAGKRHRSEDDRGCLLKSFPFRTLGEKLALVTRLHRHSFDSDLNDFRIIVMANEKLEPFQRFVC